MRTTHRIGASALAILLAAGPVWAQPEAGAEPPAPAQVSKTPIADAIRRPLVIPEAGAPLERAAVSRPARQGSYGRVTSTAEKRWRGVLGAALGAFGGLYAGGYIGAAIEGDSCRCDDPGLKGALIGAPIGAIVGGIAGGIIGSR